MLVRAWFFTLCFLAFYGNGQSLLPFLIHNFKIILVCLLFIVYIRSVREYWTSLLGTIWKELLMYRYMWYMLTFIKATKVTKLCMDKLYVASILRMIKVLSSFVMLQMLERSMIQRNRQQQSSWIIWACFK